MVNKKAQLKIQQMAIMLLVVTLFFAIVGMLVLAIKFSGMKESATVIEEEKAMLLVSKLANSPEFSCGSAFGNARTNCVDADKVIVLQENINSYEDLFEVDAIEVRKIYPKEEEVLCTIQNYPNCNLFKLIDESSSGFEYSNYVSLCRKEFSGDESYDKCELAKLIVRYD